MGRGLKHRTALLLLSCCAATVVAQKTRQDTQQDSQKRRLDGEFQSAVTAYNAGHFREAASQLEQMLPSVPNHFEVEELLGLVYVSMSEDGKALGHLETAVKLKPDSEPARTNLAASLSRMGRTEAAGEQFQRALVLAPQDYSANHNLGEFYIQQGKIAEALPYLERAQSLKPTAYDNGYDLATADLMTAEYAKAQALVQSLLKVKETGELHNLAGQVDEQSGQYVAAVNEFETAAHMDPSESNIFDWGSELMLHRTYEPAIDVFRAGAQRYPTSSRLMIGLGMTLYARGLYEDAVKALLAASDLSPSDARCYLFLSRAYNSSPSQVDAVIGRFQRYAEREPANALAQYYYAMSLWKGRLAQGAPVDMPHVEALLKSAVALDDSMSEAHQQLGNLYADEHLYEKSIPEYVRATELSPNLADAHYRLGTDYTHLGQKERAQAEFAVYQKLRSEHMAEVDKERAEVKQFVYSSRAEGASKP